MTVKKLKEESCKGQIVAANIDTSGFFSKEDVDFLVQETGEGTQISCLGMKVSVLVKFAVSRLHQLPVTPVGWKGKVFIFKTNATPEQLAEFLPFSLEEARKAA